MSNLNTGEYFLFNVPVGMKGSIASKLILCANLEYNDMCNKCETADTLQCYQTSSSPTNMDWTSAYQDNKSTSSILSILTADKQPIWTPSMLKPVASGCHPHLKYISLLSYMGN